MKFRPLCAIGAALAATLATAVGVEAATFGATLSPVSGSLGSGSATVILDDVALSVDVQVTFAGLSAPATAAHIHCCALPNSGVVLGFTAFPNATASTYHVIFTPATYASIKTGILGGTAYVNVHNQVFPAGEIRGFLAPVPEPETYALMLAGLGVLGWSAKRRQQA